MTTAVISPAIKFKAFDTNGALLSGGLVYTYVSGSSTLQTTYTSTTGITANTNPVVLNSVGEADIYLDSTKVYRFVVKTSAGVTLNTVDNITGASGSTTSGSAGSPGGINILGYGADPLGVLDSTTAIRSAMAAASTAKTYIYAPAGTYKITGSLSNASAPDCMGIVGETSTTTVFNGSTLAVDGIVFNNPPEGARFEHFRITGPGQAAAVTARGVSLTVDGLGLGISFQVVMTNVIADLWPTAGFYWMLPIVSTYTNLVAQECGAYGFFIDIRVSPYVGGTSTQFNSCYANNVLGTGYYIKSHGYTLLSSCAADNCNISYHLENCFGTSIVGGGSEVNTYIDAARPGIAVKLTNSYGCSIDSIWTYNLPNALSRQIVLVGSNYNNIKAISGYTDNGISPTYNAEVDVNSNGNVFIANTATLNATGFVSPTFTIHDLGIDTLNINDSEVKGIKFKTPNIYGNSLEVTNGSLAVSGPDLGGGAVNVFAASYPDYPIISAANTGELSFSSGAAAADVTLYRSGVGLLSFTGGMAFPGFNSVLNITGTSNPQLVLANTGTHGSIGGRYWGISNDNSGSVVFYDGFYGTSPLSVEPYKAPGTTVGEQGYTHMEYGAFLEAGARLVAVNPGTSATIHGSDTLVAGTKVVTNTKIKANSRVYFSTLVPGSAATVGHLYVSARTAGTSFTVTSTNTSDTQYFSYLIVDQD